MYILSSCTHQIDVLVKWNDGSQNVVTWSKLDALGREKPTIGATVRMWWGPQNMWWEGVILAHENENPVVEDDDIPLAALIGNENTETENEEMRLPPTTECSISEKVINESLNQDTQDLPCSIYQETCEHLNYRNAFPESFLVDGLEKENVIPLPKEVDIKVLAKENRNRGRPYINPKSGKHMPSRRRLGVRCSSCYCVKRGFCCNQFTELQRQGILDAYYDLGDLGNQRHWIKQHVTTTKQPS
ncbi:hypothetical protein BSL78_20826 [Apostichopus japonicus]|uniref:Uncharacterized protein n=1 Tax=Stichopus japonicus TaxID=307972 RepID=A0A2G8K2Z8_STIJA|nr:hypothetical protein BSL78_20826 [Apostichopus japonicus]